MKYIAAIIIIIFLGSCGGQQDLELNQLESSVVVEGWLSDIDTFQRVRLTYSQSFDDSGAIPYITDASVEIQVGTQRHSLNYADDGWYVSETKFGGALNRTNRLWVTLNNGDIITSLSEGMKSAPTIDGIEFESYERDSEENSNNIEVVYFPKATILDDGDQDNYYRFRLFRNDTLFALPEHMILVTDRFFNGNITTFENEFTGFEYSLGDSIVIELQEISQKAFDYLRLLKSQTTTVGTVSSVTPSPITGNLNYTGQSKKVLGYWGTISVKRAGIKISE